MSDGGGNRTRDYGDRASRNTTIPYMEDGGSGGSQYYLPSIEDDWRGSTIPAGSPQAGQVWIVPQGGQDAWAGQDGKLATWTGSAWTFATAPPGSTAYIKQHAEYATLVDFFYNGGTGYIFNSVTPCQAWVGHRQLAYMGGWYHGRIKGISNSKPTGLVSPWETWIMGNNPTGWVLSGGIPADYVGFIAVAVCDQLSSQIIWTYQCVNLTDYDAASDSSFDNTILHGQFSYLESLNTFVYWDSTIDITTSLSNTGWFPISFALANSVAGNIFMIQLKDFIGISPTNAYVPAWNTVANKFVLVPNGTGSGVTKLIQLTDCNVDELVGSDQKFLKWDFGTTKWIASLVPLTSIDPAGASNGQTIVLSGGVWTHELLPITSINPTGATPGQVLSYTGGVITWITNSAGVTTFAGLSDVSVTDGAGSLNKFVYWNGSFWVAGLVPIASINPAGSAAGQVLTSAGPSSPPVWAASAAVALQVVSYNAVGGASIYNNGWGTGPHYACPSGSAFVQVTCQITWTNSGGTGPVTISLARVNSGGAGYGDYAFYEAVTAVSGASTLFQGSKMMPVNPGDYFVLVGTTGAGYLAVASAYVQIVRLG